MKYKMISDQHLRLQVQGRNQGPQGPRATPPPPHPKRKKVRSKLFMCTSPENVLVTPLRFSVLVILTLFEQYQRTRG